MINEYEAKEEGMQKYLRLTQQLVDYFDDVKFEQIPRKSNSKADKAG